MSRSKVRVLRPPEPTPARWHHESHRAEPRPGAREPGGRRPTAARLTQMRPPQKREPRDCPPAQQGASRRRCSFQRSNWVPEILPWEQPRASPESVSQRSKGEGRGFRRAPEPPREPARGPRAAWGGPSRSPLREQLERPRRAQPQGDAPPAGPGEPKKPRGPHSTAELGVSSPSPGLTDTGATGEKGTRVGKTNETGQRWTVQGQGEAGLERGAVVGEQECTERLSGADS